MNKKFLIVVLLFILTVNILSSQKPDAAIKGTKAEKLYEKAITNFNKKDFDKASNYFKKTIQAAPGFIKPYLYLASISFERSDFQSSEVYYKKALFIDSLYTPDIYYSLAVVLEKQGMYEEALKHYERYISSQPKNPGMLRKAKTGSEKLKIRLKLQNQPVFFKPVPLGYEINTSESEYFPVLTGDNQKMIFTRRVLGKEDFFEADYKNGEWTNVKPISEINSPGNEGANTITIDGKTMIFTVCESRQRFGSCDLFITVKKDGKWTEIKNMGPVINSEYWDSHPSISHDGKTLYFASDRPGGIGGKDIWVSNIDDKVGWSKPECLDTNVNTRFDDFTPFIHADNNTLYFTSTGHEGMGSSDLFMSKKVNGNWTKAVNLGYPINTEDHEGGIFITLDGKTAYFCTDRFQTKVKNLDIYSFDIPLKIKPEPVSYVKGVVFDYETKEILNSEINIFDNINSNLVKTIINSQDSFLIALPGGIDYNFTVKKKGYIFHSERFLLPDNLPDLKPFNLKIALKKLGSGALDSNPFVLNNIFFDYNSSELDTIRSASELQNLISLLKDNPELNIRINGHTDNEGSDEYNSILSEKRAKSVYDHLIKKNINKIRLSFKGFGETTPVASNEDEYGRQLNRRTEFEIMKREK